MRKVKDVLAERAHLPEHFCPVPFTTVILEPDGGVGICRNHGYHFVLGNLKNQSLNEIWNGEKAQSWRREFLTDNITTCKTLIKDRRCHLTATSYELMADADLRVVQTFPILKLTANFNGFCNLRCQMCSVWKLPNGFYTEDNFWRSARKDIFPYLKDIDMLSGEPFIQDDTFKLIDEVHAVNDLCYWNFTTNMHWEFDDKVVNALKKIFIRGINISLDSLIPEVFAKIREPGNLQYVLNNIEKLLKFRNENAGRNPFELSLNVTLQMDNWKEAPQLIAYCKEKNIYPHIFILREPVKFSVLSLSQEEIKSIIDYYFEKIDAQDLIYMHRVLYPLIHCLKNIDQVQYFLRLQKDIQNS